MAGHYLRKRLRGAFLARRLAFFAVLLLVATVVVFRRGGIGFDAFAVLVQVVGGFAAAAFGLALLSLARVWRKGHAGGGTALAALFVSAIVGAPFLAAAVIGYGTPPERAAETAGMAIPADASPRPPDAEKVEGAIEGRTFPVRASQLYAAARTALGDSGWTVSGVETAEPLDAIEADDGGAPPAGAATIPIPRSRDETTVAVTGDEEEPAAAADPLDRPEAAQYRIKAVAASPILALPSDVEIRIEEDEDQAYLDLRSVSRFGRRDFGQNRRFIESFLARVDAAMVGVATSGG